MAFPAINITLPGVQNILEAEFTVSRGAWPSAGVIRCVPQNLQLTTPGTLTLTDGAREITVPDCVADTAYVRIVRRNGRRLLEIPILDSRFLWNPAKRVTREHNRRLPNGKLPEGGTNPQEIMEEILEDAEIGTVDTTALPTNVFPHLIYNDPLQGLRELLETTACDFVPAYGGGAARIVRLGTGADLPDDPASLFAPTLFLRQVPEKLIVAGGPHVWQKKLELAAWGVDDEVQSPEYESELKAIDDLSYKPAAGWGQEWPGAFYGVAADQRKRALDTVHRFFRLADTALSQSLPGAEGSEARIVLRDYLLSSLKVPLNQEGTEASDRARSAPLVQGVYWPHSDLAVNTAETDFYAGDFRVLPGAWGVLFDYPVWKLTAGALEEPDLFLLTAFESDPQVLLRRERPLGGQAPPVTLYRPELFEARIIDPEASDNVPEVQAEAEAYLDLFQPQYQDNVRYVRGYGSILPIQLDGRIAQVQYTVSVFTGAHTMASVNYENELTSIAPAERNRRKLAERLGHGGLVEPARIDPLVKL